MRGITFSWREGEGRGEEGKREGGCVRRGVGEENGVL